MITASSTEDSPVVMTASVKGMAIYLDNFAIKALAKGNPSRRNRFVEAIHKGGELLFSVANAVELSGPTAKSFEVIKGFLNELEDRWYPVELDTVEVIMREGRGEDSATSCISKKFMIDYTRVLLEEHPEGQILNFSKEFFRLGRVMDWVGRQRDSLRRGQDEFDQALRTRIDAQLIKQKHDTSWLDNNYPVLSFDARKPATFAFVGLSRAMILEARSFQIEKGDGLDFCHAVMASAFSTIGTLDWNWKRRVENLPKPNQLAHIYYEPELDRMVDDIEAHVTVPKN